MSGVIQKYHSTVLERYLPEIEQAILNYQKYIDPLGIIHNKTNVNGWQSQYDQFPFFTDWAQYLYRYIQKCFFLYFTTDIYENLHCHEEIEIFSWFNINTSNDFNLVHNHVYAKNDDSCREVSGVFYVNDPGPNFYYISTDAMETEKEHAGWLYPNKVNKLHSKAGDMLLFEPTLWHGVFKHETDTPRISIAFNVRENEPKIEQLKKEREKHRKRGSFALL